MSDQSEGLFENVVMSSSQSDNDQFDNNNDNDKEPTIEEIFYQSTTPNITTTDDPNSQSSINDSQKKSSKSTPQVLKVPPVQPQKKKYFAKPDDAQKKLRFNRYKSGFSPEKTEPAKSKPKTKITEESEFEKLRKVVQKQQKIIDNQKNDIDDINVNLNAILEDYNSIKNDVAACIQHVKDLEEELKEEREQNRDRNRERQIQKNAEIDEKIVKMQRSQNPYLKTNARFIAFDNILDLEKCINMLSSDVAKNDIVSRRLPLILQLFALYLDCYLFVVISL